MDNEIYKSFQKPSFVKTEKIVLEKQKRNLDSEPIKVPSKKAKLIGTPIQEDKSKLKHKFQFYD